MRVMRELIEDGLGRSPLDPGEASRRSMRPALPKRFYKLATVGEGQRESQGRGPASFPILLDGRSVKTPARNPLHVPSRAVAEAIAAEWQAQGETIDPATMPTTTLANSIIDGVAPRAGEVADDVAKFFASDLLFYRADGPAGLIRRQAEHWDPVLAWVADTFGARFILAEGVMPVTQPDAAVNAARKALPTDPWSIGALQVITALTGSALLGLALAHRFRSADEVWTAAHVDENWNSETWGEDELARERRALRRAEFDAAALVLGAVGETAPGR
jgi:chaperone required for assembly of F1-ATPase